MEPPSIDGMTFVRSLGTGGSANVLLYRQQIVNRDVAVKVAKRAAGEGFDIAAWRAEVTIMASLEHPNIVPIYAADVSQDGRQYIVMPYYSMGTLYERIQDAEYPLKDVLQVGIQIASALETIHRTGMLHGDVKPQNILFSAYGTPGLTDFGASMEFGGEDRAMSIAWAAPERLYLSGPAGSYSDVYSLAATLWNCLEGHPPYVKPGDVRNSAFDIMSRGRDLPVPGLSRRDAPSSLSKLLSTALAKDPRTRVGSALEFGRRLQEIQRELELAVTELVLRDSDPIYSSAIAGAKLDELPSGVTITAGWLRQRSHSLASADDDAAEDLLGREVLAAHLCGVLNQLASHQLPSGTSAESVIAHVDGRWGSGKSVLARLVLRRLSSNAGLSTPKVADPLVVWLDTWTQSRAAPAWWTMASGIRRAVSSERSRLARVGLLLADGSYRLKSSPALIFMVVAVLIAWILSSQVGWDTIGGSLTAVTGLAAVALGFGRALFWSSPTIGRLYLRTESDPMGEVKRIVNSLRRWSPKRGTRIDRVAVISTGLCVVSIAVSLALLLSQFALTSGYLMGFSTVQWGAGLSALALGVVVLPDAANSRLAGSRSRFAATLQWLLLFPLVGSFYELVVLVTVNSDNLQNSLGWAIWPLVSLPLAAGSYLFFSSLWRERSWDRRPIVIVLDDLDRCSDSSVADYLETLHSLIRDPGLVDGRRGAQVIAVVLADGRWIRSAFNAQYSVFNSLDDPTRSMAADFTQKLFDHVVLLPELTGAQVASFLGTVTDPRFAALPDGEIGSVAHRTGGHVSSTSHDDPRSNDHSTAGQVTPDIQRAFAKVQMKNRVGQEAQHALLAASESVAQAKVDHLLIDFAHIMPGNPRLIRKVANTWGMLYTLGIHIGSRISSDTLARASVFFVRFPTLVDELLTMVEPPVLGKNQGPQSVAWSRADVLEVLRLPGKGYLSPSTLGATYGRRFATVSESTDDVRTPSPPTSDHSDAGNLDLDEEH